jgi:hypothetical protein
LVDFDFRAGKVTHVKLTRTDSRPLKLVINGQATEIEQDGLERDF